jgi:diguanylate cyclase (GGDEF)-like protein/PAS domain S-box-containing protein
MMTTCGLIRCFCLIAVAILSVAIPSQAAWAEAPGAARIGVLAYRDKPATLARWQPTADYLESKLGRPFTVQVLNLDELESAVDRNELEFILTNPSHYIRLTRSNALSTPLATLIELENGKPLTQFGGVIFKLAGRKGPNNLAELKGASVAAADTASFGGYQMQARELMKAGLSPGEDIELRLTGMPQDKVVYTVLEGRAEVGFARTGLLEAMHEAGRIDISRLEVLNPRQAPGFPYRLSTGLYPEWPLAAMLHTETDLLHEVARALFALPADHPAARIGHYHGWSIPSEYETVRALLEELRIPPFDHAHAFTWRDVAKKHWPGLLFAGAGAAIIALLLFLLALRHKQMRDQELRLAQDRQQLLSALGEGVYGVNGQGLCTFVNPAALAMLGWDAPALLGQNVHELFHHRHPDGQPYPAAACPVHQTMLDGKVRRQPDWFIRRDGRHFPVELTVTPTRQENGRSGAVVVFRDIQSRHQAEIRNTLLISALEAAANAIFITDPDAHIEWINPAYETLTGFTRKEAVGRRPAEMVESGLPDQPYYANMWLTLLSGKIWRGEIVNHKRDGTPYHEELIIAPVLDENGSIIHFVGIKQDISSRKQLESELQALATTDTLTGLPNRRQILTILENEAARLQRFGETPAALLMLDLDHFKRINDQHGHAVGDAVLRRFAEVVRLNLRQTDHAGRLGGEEFVILLVGAGLGEAVAFAERLRERIAVEAFSDRDETFRITVSIGVTLLRQESDAVDEALARADAALYEAKDKGRNRVASA